MIDRDLRALDDAIARLLLRRGQLETRMVLLRRWQDVRDGRFKHELIKTMTATTAGGRSGDRSAGSTNRSRA